MSAVMFFAGGVCGLLVAWSYSLVVDRHSIGRWLGYNLLHVLALMSLGVASILIFEPSMSFAALMALEGPPDQLIAQALPMTLAFTLLSAVVISLFYRRSWKRFGAILLTSVILVLLVGQNLSVLGLISIPSGFLYLVAEFFGLIIFINLVFVLTFITLESRNFALTRLSPIRRIQ